MTTTPSLPPAALTALTPESDRAVLPTPPDSPSPGRAGGAPPARSGLGRRVTRIAAALATVAAVTLGGTASVSAMEIQNGDQTWLYLGYEVDHYWDGYQWVQWYVTKWSPPGGAGRLHCWWQTDDCWWEQHPWRQY